MGDVVILPGIERRDLCGQPLPAEQVLRAAIDKGVTDVVIVGRHRDGSPYCAASLGDVDKSIGVLMGAVTMLASGIVSQGIPEHPLPPDSQS